MRGKIHMALGRTFIYEVVPYFLKSTTMNIAKKCNIYNLPEIEKKRYRTLVQVFKIVQLWCEENYNLHIVRQKYDI